MNAHRVFRSNSVIIQIASGHKIMKTNHARTPSFTMVGIGIVLIAVGVYELAQEDMFMASSKIKEPAGFKSEGEIGDGFETTKEILRSDIILSNVVYRLELREKWAKKLFNREPELRMERNQRVIERDKIKTTEAVSLMRERLGVIRVQNKSLIDIVFVSEDADEAALIANTVAEAYQDWRIERDRRLTQGGIAALKEQLKIDDGKIKAAQNELDRLQREFNIPDAEVAGDSVRTNFPAYWKARKNLEELNDLRDLITRKMNIEEVDLRIPYHPQVIIIDLAVPSKTPVRHHRPLGAALTLIGLALFGYGLASVLKSRPLNRHDSPA